MRFLKPLAERLRPSSLEQYIGQKHLIGKGAVLRCAIESGHIPSMIFWGPPGVGKTTLAFIISKQVKRQFYVLSAINSGVKDIRDVYDKARMAAEPPILFIDEIHRFSKAQQDSLLSALKADYKKEIVVEEDDALMLISGGDARKLLNAIDLVVSMLDDVEPDSDKIVINNEKALRYIQSNLLKYDRMGEMHYDIISAFIKSVRGSDPNAAVYYLARMIDAGEDPLFIARRMLILASEDIGNANPNALLLANACFDAVNKIGWPESRIILSQTAIYLASSAKSNASYQAINMAQETVRKTGGLSVPLHLRNAPTKLMKDIGYGNGYMYAHDYEGNFVSQEFLPDEIAGTRFYNPQDNPRELELRRSLKLKWKDKYGY